MVYYNLFSASLSYQTTILRFSSLNLKVILYLLKITQIVVIEFLLCQVPVHCFKKTTDNCTLLKVN